MSTRRALFYSFLDRYSGLVLAVISSMMIARLLRPDEIGVFSVAMAMLAFAATLRDMGAGAYVVCAADINPPQITAVWTLQFSVGALLGALVAMLALPVAGFYDEPRLAPIMWVMALSYFITPIGSITYALLMREMRFQHVAVMRFSSALVGAVVSISLAYCGHGPISLAWGQLAASCTTALTSQFYRAHGQPWGFSFSGTREVLGFGSRLTGTSIVNTLVQGMPDFALGKLQGMTAAGLYSRSHGLVSMFHRLLTDAAYSVVMAHFANGKRQSEAPGADFLRGLDCLVTLNAIFGIALAVLADPVTRILYGDQWGDSVELTRWLALAGVLACPQQLCLALMMGHGRLDLLMRIVIVGGLIQVVTISIGSHFGLAVLGIAIVIGNFFHLTLWLTVVNRAFSVDGLLMLKTISKSLRCSLISCSGLAPIAIHYGLCPEQPLPSVMWGGVAVAIGSAATLVISGHPLGKEMIRFFRITKQSSFLLLKGLAGGDRCR